MSHRVTEGYSIAGNSWATDAALVYGPLADHLVARCPMDLDGRLVLDAGAGTGLAGDAARRRGAMVVAADREPDMLQAGRVWRSVVADVDHLPFGVGSFDVTVAAFVLNHLGRPDVALCEFARVTRRDGIVLASTFGADRAPAKGRIDEVLADAGWVAPAWYLEVQRHSRATATVAQVVTMARRAGLAVVDAWESPIDVGLDDPGLIVRHRLAMPQCAAFIAGLSAERRTEVVGAAVAAVADGSSSFHPVVIELVAAVTPHDSPARA